ncbi:alpha-keto acid decarboxylase family protein [Aspergillus puulaauensis]|uniref:Pyruvate decarboxylase n=1 Tax=Aspergillus puulaauensis TaxID=1220207 RepID=A0A7R7XH08_9EURO|nr:uncharacterized protein APUU_21571A [Aspergillus puulaauensis]BCS21139.1 hypothetical protein APUU_21571A [Aspergillus puulaauensis]
MGAINGGKVDLAEYLCTRLHQLGVRSVHGVPGDYNLVALDYLKPAGLHWTGNANELNAGYAADGYARIKGISALITAFGVGELSALNAIGGAYAEKVPVVHIVGTPPTTAHAQKKGLNLHHSFGDGNFRRFAGIYKDFTCAQANLDDPAIAPELIDRVLQQCLQESRPVYIELPTDMVKAKVSSVDLDHRIAPSFKPSNADARIEAIAVSTLLSRIKNAKRPAIIVDGFTTRYNLLPEADELIRTTGWPTYVTPFGKGSVNETLHNFHGVRYSDLVIRFGPLDADTNTFGFTALTPVENTVSIHRTTIDIDGRTVHADTKALLCRVLDGLHDTNIPRSSWVGYSPPPRPRELLDALPVPVPDAQIDQKTFWTRVSEFLRPHDIVVVETGTASLGANDLILPPGVKMVNSAIWLSIGCALAAAVGVSQAQRDIVIHNNNTNNNSTAGRTILFEGDGSFQMTAQALGDIYRNRLDMIVFLINNDGYTIERYIHGMKAGYNDVHPWRYLDAPSFFGAPVDDPSYPVVTRKAENWGQLMDVLADEEVAAGKGFCMVEVVMGREDAPEELKRLVQMAARRNNGDNV